MVLLLCPCCSEGSPPGPPEQPRAKSFAEWARCEALKHVWIESRRAGRDVSASAWLDWKLHKFPEFLGHRRYEHLRGEHRWLEFPADRFGAALNEPASSLLDVIMTMIKWGSENLIIIKNNPTWLFDGQVKGYISPTNLEEEVQKILRILHINAMRVIFPDDPAGEIVPAAP